MKTIRVQIALFPNKILERPDLLGNSINDKLNNLFDDMPTILNLPVDAPMEIPVVQMKSKISVYNLNIARNRIDFMIEPTVENFEIEDFKKIYVDKIQKFMDAVYENQKISRIGIIPVAYEEANNPIRVISEKYFNGALNDANELSFRKNKVISCGSIKVNSILNIESANVTINATGQNSDAILYTRDINSTQTTDNITRKQSENILNHVYSLLDSIKFREVNR